MLNPNIGKLIEGYENRYRLVIDVAHTAREIAAEAEAKGDEPVQKPVSMAINKLAADLAEK